MTKIFNLKFLDFVYTTTEQFLFIHNNNTSLEKIMDNSQIPFFFPENWEELEEDHLVKLFLKLLDYVRHVAGNRYEMHIGDTQFEVEQVHLLIFEFRVR